MNEKEPSYTELDARHNDGMNIQLLWEAETNETSIRIEDERSHKVTHFAILGEKALEAFNHPFVYAPKEETE